MTSIKIFNPNEKPFGPLSNNFYFPMLFPGDPKKYKSVTSYIYANLSKSQNQYLLVNTPVKDVFKVWKDTVLPKELISNLYKILEDGISEKIDQDEKCKNVLLKTGNAKIEYKDTNPILGTGEDDTGMNIVGKIYQQKRSQLLRVNSVKKKEENQETTIKKIWQSFLAYKYLEYKITREKNSLSSYIDKTNTSIYDELIAQHPDLVASFGIYSELQTQIKEKNLPVSNPRVNQSIIDSLDHDRQLARLARREYLGELVLILEADRLEILLTDYFECLSSKNADKIGTSGSINVIVSKAIRGFKTDTIANQNTFFKNLYELIDKRKNGDTNINPSIPDSCLDKMIEHIEQLKIPSKEEVQEAKNYNFIKPLGVIDVTADYDYYTTPHETVLVYNEISVPGGIAKGNEGIACLSLMYPSLFSISHHVYPTLCHYIYTMLILALQIPQFNIRTIYDNYVLTKHTLNAITSWYKNQTKDKFPQEQIVYTTCHAISLSYVELSKNELIRKEKKLLSIALAKKFEDRIMQDILLSTGKNNIIYTDYNDSVLGIGPTKPDAQNLTGKLLVELREQIKDQRRGEKYHIFKAEDVVFLFQNKFFKSWIEMRVGDTCKVIRLVRTYVYLKNKKQVEMNADFVKNVISYIYQPCNLIFSTSDKIKADAPEEFIRIVKIMPGFKDASLDICNAIWKHMAIMLLFLIEVIDDSSSQNLTRILSQIQYLTSSTKNCPSLSGELNNFENCTLIALINIVKNLNKFNQLYSYSSKIEKLDVEAAVSILLGNDYYNNLEMKNFIENQLDELTQNLETEESEKEKDDSEATILIMPDDIEDVYDEDEEDEITEYTTQLDTFMVMEKEFKMGVISLRSILEEELNITEDNFEIIKNSFFSGVNFIMGSTAISKKVKQNRINFFSNLNT